MRPKRKILVFSANEDELGHVGYLLWTRKYEPALAKTGKLALMAVSETGFDCAVVMANDAPHVAEAVVLALAGARPDLPIVLFAARAAEISCGLPALVRHGLDNAAMLECLRVLATRKRGPKKAGSTMAGPRGYLPSDLQRVG